MLLWSSTLFTKTSIGVLSSNLNKCITDNSNLYWSQTKQYSFQVLLICWNVWNSSRRRKYPVSTNDEWWRNQSEERKHSKERHCWSARRHNETKHMKEQPNNKEPKIRPTSLLPSVWHQHQDPPGPYRKLSNNLQDS